MKALAAPLATGTGDAAKDNELVQRALAAASTIGGESFGKALDAELRSRLGDWHLSGLAPGAASLQEQLSTAAAAGDTEGARALLRQGAKVDAPSVLGMPPLHAAAGAGHVGVVRLLLSGASSATQLAEDAAGTQQEQADGAGVEVTTAATREAASDYASEVLRALERRDRHGLTPLHLAVTRYRYDPLANPEGASLSSSSSLEREGGDTRHAGLLQVVHDLGKRGARFDGILGAPGGVYALPPAPSAPGSSSTSAASATTSSRRGAQGGSDADAARARAIQWADRDAISGRTVLHAAAAADSHPRALLTRLVILGCNGSLQQCPSDLLQTLQDTPLPTLQPALTDSRDPEGLTALVYACAHGHVSSARALLEAGASVHGATREAGLDSDPAFMPLTVAMEAYATAMAEASTAASALESEQGRKGGEGAREHIVRELTAGRAHALASAAACKQAIQLLLDHGAVLSSRPVVEASSLDSVPWETIDVDPACAAVGAGGAGAPLLLPQLAAACSEPDLADLVELLLQHVQGAAKRVNPLATANDGVTSALYVACLCLNARAVQALAGHTLHTLTQTSRQALGRCVQGGLQWVQATAAQVAPGQARQLLEEAKGRASEIRGVLGLELQASPSE